MYNLTNVTLVAGKKGQRQCLLNKVNVEFAAGKISTILGANGAGKSTLLKTLLGEYKPNSGQVHFSHGLLESYSQKELSFKRAYIAQQSGNMFNVMAIDYLKLARLQYNESDGYTQNLVLDIAKQFNITHLLLRELTQLSGGELQLIEYTRAYLQLYNGGNFSGKCLLLDEPASALDIKQTLILYQHLRDFNHAGGSVIIIDHNLNAVSALASHVVMLKAGQVLAQGAKSKVYTQHNLNQCFDTHGTFIYPANANQNGQQTQTKPHAIYHVALNI